jgi:hypothetical protein
METMLAILFRSRDVGDYYAIGITIITCAGTWDASIFARKPGGSDLLVGLKMFTIK